MAKIDLEKQKDELARMRDELSRLNRQLDVQKEAAGFKQGEPVKVDEKDITPEVRRAMDAAREEAERAGREAAAGVRTETAAPTGATRRARRGSIAI